MYAVLKLKLKLMTDGPVHSVGLYNTGEPVPETWIFD